MEDLYGNPMEEASGSGYQVRIPLPQADSKMLGLDGALLAVYLQASS
jgi:hypothetical protein